MGEKTDAVKIFEDIIAFVVDDEGVYPMAAVVVGENGLMNILCLALEGEALLMAVEKACRQHKATEFVFGLDTYCQEAQGTTLDSCVVIFHGKDGHVRVGVWEYSTTGLDVETKPTNWGNEFWHGQYSKVCETVANWLFDGGKRVN